MQLDPAQLARLDREGFLILPGVFTDEEVELLRAEVRPMLDDERPENAREAGGSAVRNALSLHRRSDLYRRLVRHPRLVGPARQIIGEAVYPQQVKINLKTGFDGGGFDWHTDFATHHHRDGVQRPVALNMHIHLDDVTEFNGPIMFVPGSHKRDIPQVKSVDGEKWELWTVPQNAVRTLVEDAGMVSAKGSRGTLLVFGDRLLHVSAPNVSPYPRWIFSVIYNACSNPATRDVPEMAHERDRSPVEALTDDCLLRPAATAAH